MIDKQIALIVIVIDMQRGMKGPDAGEWNNAEASIQEMCEASGVIKGNA